MARTKQTARKERQNVSPLFTHKVFAQGRKNMTNCIQNNKTRRCRKSEFSDSTSHLCTFSNSTKRCVNLKNDKSRSANSSKSLSIKMNSASKSASKSQFDVFVDKIIDEHFEKIPDFINENKFKIHMKKLIRTEVRQAEDISEVDLTYVLAPVFASDWFDPAAQGGIELDNANYDFSNISLN